MVLVLKRHTGTLSFYLELIRYMELYNTGNSDITTF